MLCRLSAQHWLCVSFPWSNAVQHFATPDSALRSSDRPSGPPASYLSPHWSTPSPHVNPYLPWKKLLVWLILLSFHVYMFWFSDCCVNPVRARAMFYKPSVTLWCLEQSSYSENYLSWLTDIWDPSMSGISGPLCLASILVSLAAATKILWMGGL